MEFTDCLNDFVFRQSFLFVIYKKDVETVWRMS